MLGALIAVLALAVLWIQQFSMTEDLPTPKSAQKKASKPDQTPTTIDTASNTAPQEGINLAVPFAPQAPHANWDQPYQDACEEASIIMIERYLRGVSLSLDEMDAAILDMVEFQNKNYGFFKDSNIAETARLVEDYWPHLSARTVYDITAADIRSELAQGNPVAVLVDGRKLGSPYYTQPGPDKHALVIKGMKDNKFITNDPGTRRGQDFVYSTDTVMNAIVDYDGETKGSGQPAMIVITLS